MKKKSERGNADNTKTVSYTSYIALCSICTKILCKTFILGRQACFYFFCSFSCAFG